MTATPKAHRSRAPQDKAASRPPGASSASARKAVAASADGGTSAPEHERAHERTLETATGGAMSAQLTAMGKAFSILEIVAGARHPISMAEVIRRTGLTKPTAHRITALLADMGFIERDALRRGMVEGPRLIALALDTLSAAAPRSIRHAILKQVSETVGETCNFGVLLGAEVVYLDRVETKWPLGLRFEAGSRVPAHCTAIGKLLLSQLSPRERRDAIAAMPLSRYTARTLTDRQSLADALERIAQTRIGIDDQEFMDGVVCIALPVIADGGQVVGGIAISAPQARVDLEQALQFAPVMREAAQRLGATFRLTPPAI